MHSLVLIALTISGVSAVADYTTCHFVNTTAFNTTGATGHVYGFYIDSITTGNCSGKVITLPSGAFHSSDRPQNVLGYLNNKRDYTQKGVFREYHMTAMTPCVNKTMISNLLSYEIVFTQYANLTTTFSYPSNYFSLYRTVSKLENVGLSTYPYYYLFWKLINYPGACNSTTIAYLDACTFGKLYDRFGIDIIVNKRVPSGCGLREREYYLSTTTVTTPTTTQVTTAELTTVETTVETTTIQETTTHEIVVEEKENLQSAEVIIGIAIGVVAILGLLAGTFYLYRKSWACFKPKRRRVYIDECVEQCKEQKF